jgi:hypothetical protein
VVANNYRQKKDRHGQGSANPVATTCEGSAERAHGCYYEACLQQEDGWKDVAMRAQIQNGPLTRCHKQAPNQRGSGHGHCRANARSASLAYGRKAK